MQRGWIKFLNKKRVLFFKKIVSPKLSIKIRVFWTACALHGLRSQGARLGNDNTQILEDESTIQDKNQKNIRQQNPQSEKGNSIVLDYILNDHDNFESQSSSKLPTRIIQNNSERKQTSFTSFKEPNLVQKRQSFQELSDFSWQQMSPLQEKEPQNYKKIVKKFMNEMMPAGQNEILQNKQKTELKGKFVKETPFFNFLTEKNQKISGLASDLAKENRNRSYYQIYLGKSILDDVYFIIGSMIQHSAKAIDFCRVYRINKHQLVNAIKQDDHDYESFKMLKDTLIYQKEIIIFQNLQSKWSLQNILSKNPFDIKQINFSGMIILFRISYQENEQKQKKGPNIFNQDLIQKQNQQQQ
ncbi:hypothetical protein ABPG72_022662 [Tetrahymena utriculariae]